MATEAPTIKITEAAPIDISKVLVHGFVRQLSIAYWIAIVIIAILLFMALASKNYWYSAGLFGLGALVNIIYFYIVNRYA